MMENLAPSRLPYQIQLPATLTCSALRPTQWDFEYSAARLPTSYRTTPSRSLIQTEALFGPISGKSILDIGCGLGRNSFYLGQNNSVHGIDFSTSAIRTANERRRQFGEGATFELHDALVEKTDYHQKFDVILDSYFSCHILSSALLTAWLTITKKYLKKDGLFISFGFSPDDEYYSAFPHQHNDGFLIAADSITGLYKRIDSTSQGDSTYEGFETRHLGLVQFNDIVLGSYFKRSIILRVARTV